MNFWRHLNALLRVKETYIKILKDYVSCNFAYFFNTKFEIIDCLITCLINSRKIIASINNKIKH